MIIAALAIPVLIVLAAIKMYRVIKAKAISTADAKWQQKRLKERIALGKQQSRGRQNAGWQRGDEPDVWDYPFGKPEDN